MAGRGTTAQTTLTATTTAAAAATVALAAFAAARSALALTAAALAVAAPPAAAAARPLPPELRIVHANKKCERRMSRSHGGSNVRDPLRRDGLPWRTVH